MEAKKCNTCGKVYEKALHYCPEDGQKLELVNTMIGQTLDGRYRIEAMLGRGGMGVVYRATHIHLDTQFAVKILNQELVANQSAIERFRREAKAAGRIHHPNAIQVTDFGVTDESVVFLVMELADGKTLGDLLHTVGSLDYRRAIALMLQICAAIEAAHQGGVIHRDLKPDNIIIKHIGASERVKVLDFGIAKLREREPTSESDALPDDPDPLYRTITEAGAIVGTPHYMSPEQCCARKLDPRSDVYSLGVILYEMLSGKLPHSSDVAMEVVVKHIREAPRPLREVLPNIPHGIERAVMRALEKDPAKRQASAAEFADELQRALFMAEDETSNAYAETVISQSPILSSSEERRARELVSTSINVSAADIATSKARSATTKRYQKWGMAWIVKWPVILVGLLLLSGLIAGLIYLSKRAGTDISSIPDEMVSIPGGTFKMGRDDGALDERPAHEVTVRSFYLDKYEVTNEKYKKFVDQAPHQPPPHWTNGTYPLGEAKMPVTHVSWYDAAEYARWAGKRLPTEEEWEYAARNGRKQNLFPWGDNWRPNMAAVGILNLTKPYVVGSFETDKNELGVYDLAGNVSEWVENNYRSYDGKNVYERKVFRGGSFAEREEPAEKITSTYRFYVPADPESNIKPKIGFRCAKDIQ